MFTKKCHPEDICVSETRAIYGFDRLTIWIDVAECPISQSALEKHCTSAEIGLESMMYNAKWKLKISLFQPSPSCFKLLEEALGHSIAACVSYVEITCDLPSSDAAQARAKRNCFLAAAKMLHCSHRVVLEEHGTCFYYAPRVSSDESRWPRVIAAYADKPSKINNARPTTDAIPCAHIECRVSGVRAIADIGIVTLSDLMAFDHRSYWEKAVRFYELPMRKDLGALVAKAEGASRDVTDAALRKRAANWTSDFSIKDDVGSIFIMHNALLEYPELRKVFKTMSFANWLKLLNQVKR